MKKIRLGFELKTGEPVDIPLRHMVVCGQTQEAGKTTTMEALIHRAQLPAIAFITKRGERSFEDARRLQPYFRERADWQFVAAILEATMRERMKFERSWIIQASKGAKTLAAVQENVRKALKDSYGVSHSVYTTLDAYLDIVVPRIARLKWAKSITIAPGVNVMDVADREDFPPELQGLVMRSALEWVYEKADGTITIIPEAWEFLPQMRGSPVKLAAVELIRKGAGLKNYVWLDSQDIGGVDKEVLRSCPVWLLGVQREANEIDRTLDNIPAGFKKPKAAEIATLKIGQFFACFGDHVIKTYVQPKWMDEQEAQAIARGATGGAVSPPAERRPGLQPGPEFIVPGPDQLAAREKKGYERGYTEGFDKGYAAAASTLVGQISGVITSAQAFLDELRRISHELATSGARVADVQKDRIAFDNGSEWLTVRGSPKGVKIDPHGGPSYAERFGSKAKKPAAGDAGKPAGMKLLDALVRFDGLAWHEAAVVAGITPDNGYFYGGKKWLVERKLVIEDAQQRVRCTPRGASEASTHAAAPTLAELLALWRPKLRPPGGEMLAQLALTPERAIATDALAAAIKRQPGNGYWYGGVKALRKNNLAIDADGTLQLASFLASLERS